MTPLKIDRIKAIHKDIDRVDIDGQAVLFESAIYAKLPEDMSEALALAALDVAGAPAQARKLPKEGDSVLILGANGKSVAMKTVALNALLFSAGFLVCAKRAKLPLFRCVRMLFDDAQSMQSGLSGFGSEIVRFNEALKEVEEGYSLFLLDEFARGTNPDEGAVIVHEKRRIHNFHRSFYTR